MTAKEYIITTLNSLVYIFDDVECRYRYDSFSEAHYIQILPAVIFKESKELKNYRGQILNRFYNLFDNESIVFLTDDSLIKMDSIEMRFTGKRFSILPTTTIFGKFVDPLISTYQDMTWDLFANFEPHFDKTISVGLIKSSHLFSNQRTFLKQGSIVCRSNAYNFVQLPNPSTVKLDNTKYKGENNYALSA